MITLPRILKIGAAHEHGKESVLSGVVKQLSDIRRGRVPGQVIIQITDRCNARCPHCGMRVSNTFGRSSLANDVIFRIIDAAAANHAAAISFTGGEPLLRLDDLVLMIDRAGNAGIPLIRTGTNGYFMREDGAGKRNLQDRVKRVAEKLAATRLRNFWISIDSSVPEVHDRMRGFEGLTRGIEASLPIFNENGIFPSVNLGVNRNIGGELTSALDSQEFKSRGEYLDAFYGRYKIAMREFYRRVIDMGFTMLNTCYPMSVETGAADGLSAVYAATAADRIVTFERDEKAILFKVLMECVEEFRNRIRIFSPLVSLCALARQYAENGRSRFDPSACRGGVDFFFIDAGNGDAYPCGYRGGENLGKYWNLDLSRLDRRAFCRQCDWECFRDPSEHLAPVLDAVRSPVRLAYRMIADRTYAHLWLKDLMYYRACDFFDGRRPPRNTDPGAPAPDPGDLVVEQMIMADTHNRGGYENGTGC